MYAFSAATERCPHLTADEDRRLRGWLPRGEGTAADTCSADLDSDPRTYSSEGPALQEIVLEGWESSDCRLVTA